MKPKKGLIVESKAEVVRPEENETENVQSVVSETDDDATADAQAPSDGTASEASAEVAEQLQEQRHSASASPRKVAQSKSKWWLKYLITTAVLSVATLLFALLLGVFGITNTKFLLGELSTAFFVPGIFAVGFGFLIMCSNGGAYDIFAYGFRQVVRMFKKDPLDRKYGSYAGYRKAQREKKRSFWYLVIVGAVFVAVGGALLLAFNLI